MESPQTSPRVLLVDDEPNVRESIALNLRKEGLEVVLAADGDRAVELARQVRPDLIVLDVMLPGMDGYEVCRVIREESTVPILLLSARGEAIDRIVGLDLGADDYLTKPFAMRELMARVRAMLRRARMTEVAGADSSSPSTSGSLEAGDIAIDQPRRSVTVGGSAIDLKPKEFDLLAYFVQHPEIVHSRSALLREVWGYDYAFDTRTVDVHVRWLRRKIETDPALPLRIQTVRGHGYRFVVHERA